MNKIERATAIGALALSNLTGCSGCSESATVGSEGSSYVVTESALPWYYNGYTILRQSRAGIFTCIMDEDFGDAALAGDRIELKSGVDPGQIDGCLSPDHVELISKERGEIARVTCQVEGSVDQLAYLDLAYGINAQELTGFSWTGEDDNRVWWESAGNIEDMIDPEIVGTREDPDYGTLNTYRYDFSLPRNLVQFSFENPDSLYSNSYLASNYWPNNSSAFFLSFEDCKVEE